jgi:hypothetical protein
LELVALVGQILLERQVAAQILFLTFLQQLAVVVVLTSHWDLARGEMARWVVLGEAE